MRDFEADRKLCEAATPGPWKVGVGIDAECDECGETVSYSAAIIRLECNDSGICDVFVGDKDADNAEFIAAARDGWPDALKRIAELETKLKTYELYKENAESIISENRNLLRKQADALIDAQQKLAPAEKERDEERAHNAVLRQALECLSKEKTCEEFGRVSVPTAGANKDEQYLKNITPSDSAAKVQKLVDALSMLVDTMDDQLSDGGYIAEIGIRIDPKMEPWDSLFNAREKAQQALAEWRGEK